MGCDIMSEQHFTKSRIVHIGKCKTCLHYKKTLCSSSHIQAIHGYRETERLSWGAECEEVLNRVRSVAFPADSALLGPVHILDLDKSGYIKPHIDSVKAGFLCSD